MSVGIVYKCNHVTSGILSRSHTNIIDVRIYKLFPIGDVSISTKKVRGKISRETRYFMSY